MGFDLECFLAAVNLEILSSVYWVCLIVGGGLLLLSTFAGNHGDADLGGDIHVDVGADLPGDVGHLDVGSAVVGHGNFSQADAPVHLGALTTWFSIRFLVFFLAVFGLVGVALTQWTGISAGAILAYAAVSGLLVGQGVHQLLRKLNRSSGDSATRPEDYFNKWGRVTIRIEPPRIGEVAVRIAQGERFVPARAKRHGRAFQVGEQVAVVGYAAGIAEVVSREEFEFLALPDGPNLGP